MHHVPLLPALANRLQPMLTWPVSHWYVAFPHTSTVMRRHGRTCVIFSQSPNLVTYADFHNFPPSSLLQLVLLIMDPIRNEYDDRMVKIELEAAEALAGLAHFPAHDGANQSTTAEPGVKNESNSSSSSSFDTFHSNSYENATNFMVKKSEKPGILTAKSMKDEQSTELGLNPAFPTHCASSGRKSKQNITEAEMEARKIRRVLANRESARQTIRRRQAVFEELTRKAVDLAWENENLKRDKDVASKQYDSLKTKNECLKAQMIKIGNVETEETREESITTNEQTISASSTNSPFIIYNQPPYLPFVWPNSIQLQCGPPAGIVFPSNIPISAANKTDSSSCKEGSSMTGSSLYILPYPWLVTLPQPHNSYEHHLHSFNLNDKPIESSECQQFFPEKVKSEIPNHNGFPPDGGGGQKKKTPVSCEALIEHDDTNTLLTQHLKPSAVGDSDQIVEEIHKIHQIANVYSGKRLGDTAAATEARKRRKQLSRLKNHFHSRQLRMH